MWSFTSPFPNKEKKTCLLQHFKQRVKLAPTHYKRKKICTNLLFSPLFWDECRACTGQYSVEICAFFFNNCWSAAFPRAKSRVKNLFSFFFSFFSAPCREYGVPNSLNARYVPKKLAQMLTRRGELTQSARPKARIGEGKLPKVGGKADSSLPNLQNCKRNAHSASSPFFLLLRLVLLLILQQTQFLQNGRCHAKTVANNNNTSNCSHQQQQQHKRAFTVSSPRFQQSPLLS